MDKNIMAARLRELRGNIPRDTVCKSLGISMSSLSMYENGDRVPRDKVKVSLAKFYGKSITFIFFDH